MSTPNTSARTASTRTFGRFAVSLAAALTLGASALTARAGAPSPHWIPAPIVKKIGPHLYAYVSDDDNSSNSTFLVRKTGILVVDTGLDRYEAGKLLAAIRKISDAPIRYVINTHYHPDHQGGNGVIGPHAVILSTARTRELLLQMIAGLKKAPAKKHPDFVFRPATLTVADQRNWQQALRSPTTLYLDGEPVVIYAPGPGHTLGDAVVYFPEEKAVSAGDLFMNRSCPDMDKGSLANWVKTLKGMLALDANYYVPGHFNIGTRRNVLRFYDYLSTLSIQVQQLYLAGVPIDEVPARLHLAAFSDFRQFPRFDATFAANAKQAYHELKERDGLRAPAAGSAHARASSGGTAPERVPVQFLLKAAATDFHTHPNPYPARFRDVRIGHVIAPDGTKQYLMCGRFLSTHETGKAEWVYFATIKTSGYEQYLGAGAADMCRRPSIRWDTSQDLSPALQQRLDSSP